MRLKIKETATANGIDIADRLAALPGPTGGQLQAAGMTPAAQNAMARQMVESLADKLRADPRNPDGWMRLMRARMVLGDTTGAAQALQDARTAYAGDSSRQAAFAQAARSLGVPGR